VPIILRLEVYRESSWFPVYVRQVRKSRTGISSHGSASIIVDLILGVYKLL
jgi:hypothetical protein